MQIRLLTCVIAASALVGCQSVGSNPGSYSSDLDHAKIMAENAELAARGPEHDRLAKFVGDWVLEVKVRWNPDSEWTTETGTSNFRPAVDGRYYVEEVFASISGEAYHGYNIRGFNNLTQQYFSVWMDSSSTWPTYCTGSPDAEGKVTLSGRHYDAATPGGRPFHRSSRIVSDNEIVTEVFDTIDGEPVKVMEIRRTRR